MKNKAAAITPCYAILIYLERLGKPSRPHKVRVYAVCAWPRAYSTAFIFSRMFKTAEQIFILFVLDQNLHSAAIKSRVVQYKVQDSRMPSLNRQMNK